MNKDLLNQFGWIVNSFDFDGDGSLDDSEAMFTMNTFGAMAHSGSFDVEKSLYELAAAGVDVTLFDLMDTNEKREAIEDAGLDPDDYELD